MKQPLKILSIIDIPWNSGLAHYAFEQALALRAGGHEVAFACPPGSAAARFAEKTGCAYFPIPGRKELSRYPAAVLELSRLVREKGFHFACPHTGLAQTVSWCLKKLNPGLKIVRVKADARRPSAGFTLSSVDRVISASAFIEDAYLAAGLDPAKSALIRQGIETPPFEHAPPAPPLKIGMLGRLDPVKGHEVFLRAAALLLKDPLAAEFHIAGYEAGVKYADLEALAAKLGITEAVKFHGKVDGYLEFMRGCHIGVIASLGSEAVSRAALEWLACGRPLVATSAGSLPEFARRDLLAAPGDPADLAAKIRLLASSEVRMADDGPLNREKAVSEYGKREFAEATCWLFETAARR